MNSKQRYKIRIINENIIKKEVPFIENKSGIYFFEREENGFKYAYVGQAKHLLDRLASHLSGYQHIDLSLKKHGFKTFENKEGWEITYLYFDEKEIDEKEQFFIKEYANKGYQMLNKTTGSQGKGKNNLGDKVTKGYLQGLSNGYLKAQKEVANLFEKHLNVSVKKEGNKNQIKALEKFKIFIGKE